MGTASKACKLTKYSSDIKSGCNKYTNHAKIFNQANIHA